MLWAQCLRVALELRRTSVGCAFAQAISPPASHIGWSCWVPGHSVCVCVVCGENRGSETDYYANTPFVPCQYIFTNVPLSFSYLLPTLYIYIYVNIRASVNNTRKIRAFSWHAKQAQGGGARRGWLGNAKPLLPYPRERPSVYLVEVWASCPVWTGVENLEPTGVRASESPACYSHCSIM